MNSQHCFKTPQTAEYGKPKWMFLVLISAIFLSLFLVSCGKEKKVEAENLINVAVVPAETKTIQNYIATTGTLKADEEVTVSSEVNGIVKTIMAREGFSVAAGDVMAEINDVDYLLDTQRSEAAFKQAEANLANVRAEYQRKESLFKEELITRQQFDDLSTRVTLAEADVLRAKAALETSRERLARTRIYAPMSGLVKERRISAGDYVLNSSPLFQLIKVDSLKLNFTVGEKDAAALKTGQKITFSVDAFPERTFEGRVSMLYPHVEERTRTLQAEALVPNKGHLLKPGLFARVTIQTDAPRKALIAPSNALLYDGNIIRVFIADGDIARERVVKAGITYGDYVEIVEGLKEGEQIVVVGQSNLTEGVKLNVAR